MEPTRIESNILCTTNFEKNESEWKTPKKSSASPTKLNTTLNQENPNNIWEILNLIDEEGQNSDDPFFMLEQTKLPTSIKQKKWKSGN